MATDIDYEALYEATIPSVVSIYVTPMVTAGSGTGSGFVYDHRGHVVTNDHVVTRTDRRGGAVTVDTVEVRFSDGAWRSARVVGTDRDTDLAVIRVEDLPTSAQPLPVASENPHPGQRVAALGNPMGLDGTITTGVVSGVNRSMAANGGYAIPDTVQTDAAINPGNSGGPLVSVFDGAEDVVVVGVNRAKQGDNIGFAISPAIVNRVVPELIETGECRHATLHVSTLDVSPIVAEANGFPTTGGVLVVDVKDGPASGVLRGCREEVLVHGRPVPVGGDVVLGVNDEPLRSHEELTRYLLTTAHPNRPIELTIRRNGVERVVTVTPTDRGGTIIGVA